MASHEPVHRPRDRGFSLVEMLIVVAIVAIMAAVALPAIGSYVRNYRVKGAASEVAGMIQTARSRAIMSNTNSGVSFVVVDRDSYRFIQEDLAAPERFGPLQDLPLGVSFLAATGAGAGDSIRFNRLGGFCNPAAGGACDAAVAVVCPSPEDSLRCNDSVSTYVGADASMSGGAVITVIEDNTRLQRTIRIAPGGRVLPQP